jgi:hypothetical protein
VTPDPTPRIGVIGERVGAADGGAAARAAASFDLVCFPMRPLSKESSVKTEEPPLAAAETESLVDRPEARAYAREPIDLE